MKMATWRHLLRATSDRILDSEVRIERQRRRIAELARDGSDTVLAEQELAVLVTSNEQLKASLARLLEGYPGAPPPALPTDVLAPPQPRQASGQTGPI